MSTNKNLKQNRGQALIELVIGFAILSIVLTSITLLIIVAREARTRDANILEAENALVSQNEALRSVRESGWDRLTNGIYHLVSQESGWTLVLNSETINGFERQIVIDDVCRDGSGNLVDCPGGTIDPSTKKITSKVSWEHFFGGNVENIIYLTRNLNNDTWIQTTRPEFGDGTFIDTVSTEDTDDGEVILDTGVDWSSPQLLSFYNNPGAARAFDVEVQNDFAYLVTGNGGKSTDLEIIDVSDKNSPVKRGGINLNTKVNGVSVEDDNTEGHFAYLATNENSKELIVVNTLNKTSPTEAASLNLGDKKNALAIFLHGAKNKKFAYITKESSGSTNRELYIVSVNTCFDVTGDGRVMSNDFTEIQSHYGETGESIYDINGDNSVTTVDTTLVTQRISSLCPHAPVPNVVGSFEVGGGNANAAKGVFVVNDTVYLATARDDKELIVIDVSNKTSPQEIGFFNTGQNEDANDVFIFGQKAYLVTNNNSGTNPEFYVLEISIPGNLSGSPPLGTYNVDGTINAVFGLGGLAYLATANNSKEFLVLNTSNPASISEFGFLDLSPGTNDANGIFKVGNFVFLATDNNSRELQIIGAGAGSNFATEGTYESSTFDAGANVGFNRLTWSEQIPASSNIQFQIATNNDASTWNFVGPNGLGSSFYDSPGAIPLNSVSAQYFRFKATLSGDGSNTPILEDITVNYSP